MELEQLDGVCDKLIETLEEPGMWNDLKEDQRFLVLRIKKEKARTREMMVYLAALANRVAIEVLAKGFEMKVDFAHSDMADAQRKGDTHKQNGGQPHTECDSVHLQGARPEGKRDAAEAHATAKGAPTGATS